jgi:hypothetical protein
MPQMIKRRTSNGLLMPVGSLVEPLKANTLINTSDDHQNIAQPWRHWWAQSSADRFYVYDHAID